MDENKSSGSSRAGPTGKKHRYAVDDEDDTEDQVDCSGRSCRSCTAGMLADCVALCCCPCAVVNFLTLAFLKVPWMVGRRCLGKGKKKFRKRLEKRKTKCCERNESNNNVGVGNVISRKEELELELQLEMNGALEIESSSFGFVEEEQKDNNYSARFEAEKVWLELYQVGHLGFGRVSYTGIQSLGKG